MYYVYRYLDNNEKPVYIGITNELSIRRKSHRNYSDWYSEELRYQFIEVSNRYIAKTYEEYLINKHAPIGNKACNNEYDVSEIQFNIKSEWRDFNKKEIRNVKEKEEKRKNVKHSSFEIQKRYDRKLVYDMFFLHKDKILNIDWDDGKPVSVTFDSKEVKEIVLGIKTIPRFTSAYHGNEEDNITRVFLVTTGKEYMNSEDQQALNEIYNLLIEQSLEK